MELRLVLERMCVINCQQETLETRSRALQLGEGIPRCALSHRFLYFFPPFTVSCLFAHSVRAGLLISTCVVYSQGDKGNQGRDGKKGEPGTCDIKVCKRIYITVISQLADHKRLKEMY